MALFQVNQHNAVSNASSGIGSSVSGIGSNVASHSNFDGENLPEVQQAATGSVPAAAAAVPAAAGANGSAAAAVGANAPAAVPVAAPQVKNVNVSSMTVEEKIKYVLHEGKGIANRAFEKVKTKFFNDSMPIDGKKNGRISEKNALDSLKTISDVQDYKRELVKKLEKAEQDVINAPEKASSPNNGPKLKGAMIQNRNAQKKYNDLLMPVLHVLESKMIASNTLLTLSPLEVKYHTLSEQKGDDDLEVKRQKAIFYTALKQYATEIKNVIDGVDDTEIKKDLDNIQLIIDALEKEASSAPLLDKNGTALANHSKKPAGPIGVTVPIKNKDGIIEYASYQMDNGVFSKLDRPIEDNKAVEDKFKEAVKSAKEGTKVVKMTYKDEPLIVSMNISHPNQSIEKANMNMQNALKKEAQTFVPSVTTNNGMTRPGRTENINLSSLSMNELETAQKKVQKDIDFVNTNTKVAPQNKETLKKEIQRSRMMPINAAIAMKARQRGGKTAKKSKKNNKTKKSTRRSS